VIVPWFALAAVAHGADAEWLLGPAQLAALERREIVVDAAISDDAWHGAVRAAVRIAQPSATIYAAMIDCSAALRYVPHLERCRVLESSADERSQVIEHIADLGWYLPATHYVFRADYEAPRRIAFRLVRGELRELVGEWQLLPAADGAATIVTYQVRIVPKLRVPRWAIQRSLRGELPALLQALRTYVEAPASAAGAARPASP
jgi:uncharacterized protein YndB with AHSA1/START domain